MFGLCLLLLTSNPAPTTRAEFARAIERGDAAAALRLVLDRSRRDLGDVRAAVEDALNVDPARRGAQAPAPPVPAAAPAATTGPAFVSGSSLAVRARPDPGSEALGHLSINSEVEVVDRKGDWARIRTRNPLPPRQVWVWPTTGEPRVSQQAMASAGWVRADFLEARPVDEQGLAERAAAYVKVGDQARALVVLERRARLTGSGEATRAWLAAAWSAADLHAVARALLAASGSETVAGLIVERIETVESCNGPLDSARLVQLDGLTLPKARGSTCIVALPRPCPYCNSPSDQRSAREVASEVQETAAEVARARAFEQNLRAAGYRERPTVRVSLRNLTRSRVPAQTTLHFFQYGADGPGVEATQQVRELRTPAVVEPGQSVIIWIEAGSLRALSGAIGVSDVVPGDPFSLSSIDGQPRVRSIARGLPPGECPCD